MRSLEFSYTPPLRFCVQQKPEYWRNGNCPTSVILAKLDTENSTKVKLHGLLACLLAFNSKHNTLTSGGKSNYRHISETIIQ